LSYMEDGLILKLLCLISEVGFLGQVVNLINPSPKS